MKLIKVGSKGYNVRVLQRLLHVYPDGIFGPMTEAAVRSYQERAGLVVDGIVGEKTWRSLVGTFDLAKRRIDEIIIHCSDTVTGARVTVDDIRSWHVQRGFSDVGYHYIIYEDGSIHKGRDIKVAGAHCQGHNMNSIGICYIGGRNKRKQHVDTRTPEQKEALQALIRTLRQYYPDARILGHRDCSEDKDKNGIITPEEWMKACPCYDVQSEIE